MGRTDRATRGTKTTKLAGIDEARRRIAEAARTGATVLDLGGLGLTEVPEELYALRQLEVLYLGAAEGVRDKPFWEHTHEDKKKYNALRALPPALFLSLPYLTHLHLENNRIVGLPEQIAALTNLTYLNLDSDRDGNQIGDDGARAIATLKSLASLNLRHNQIGTEGARAIAALKSLTSLNLWGNQIGPDGARAIAALKSLTSLNLWSNQIEDDGARSIATLTSLTSLDLGGNEIGDDGARSIATLTSLTSLDLGGNEIGDDGARAIATLTGLTSLDLWDNKIGSEGARAIASLESLTSLDLRDNRIGADGASSLFDTWTNKAIGRLVRLDIGKNDIGDLGVPAEVIESCDAEAILAAYRAFQRAELQGRLKPLNEAKMLVVGNEAVGKTSLIRYLVHGQPRDPDEKKTEGTAIQEKIEIQNWSPEAADIKLNVWDFGGQEIMHGTHRYFLTRRSLYLIVLEDRKEDDRSIYNWLRIIKNRGGDAPIIVVINKSDKGKEALRLDEEGLQREYPEIVKFLRTSCSSGKWAEDSVKRLRKAIVACLAKHQALKQVRDAVPESWLWVRQRIAERARAAHVLRIVEFERLCIEAADQFPDAESLRGEATQRGLLRLLHDLGVLIVHGLSKDDVTVSPSVALLDPNWLTGAIYTVLNRAELVQQKGKFDRTQLSEWLDLAFYPTSRHKFILDMMQDEELGLAFEIPGSKGAHFLVPEGLPKNSPDHSTWPKDSLRFRFRYDFLPPGLIPRLIVAAHENLTEKEDKWVSGAVFQYRGCCMLIEGDVKKNVIDIAVADGGDNRRAALHVILNYFDHVHRLNPEVKPQAFVPMPDAPEIGEGYEFLLQLEKEEGADYRHRPTGSKHAYRVGDLLDGVGRRIGGEKQRMSGMKIDRAGDINMTFVNGDIRGVHNEIGRQQTSRVEQVAASAESMGAPKWWHWPLITFGCAILAAVALIAYDFAPPSWQRYLIVFEAAFGILFLLNPAWFYRRMMAFALSAGLLGGALSGVLNIKIGDASLSWEGGASAIFYLAMLAVIIYFVRADQKAGRA
jgi:internalin A